MASLASQIIKCNDLDTRIKVSALHSTSLPPPSPQAPPYSICTSELLDYQLLGEGILPTLNDLHARRILGPSTAVVPSSAVVRFRVLSKSSGFTSHSDTPSTYAGIKLPPDDLDSSPPIIPYQPYMLPPEAYLTPACTSFGFDFTNPTPAPSQPTTTTTPASRSGTAVAIIYWWEVRRTAIFSRWD